MLKNLRQRYENWVYFYFIDQLIEIKAFQMSIRLEFIVIFGWKKVYLSYIFHNFISAIEPIVILIFMFKSLFVWYDTFTEKGSSSDLAFQCLSLSLFKTEFSVTHLDMRMLRQCIMKAWVSKLFHLCTFFLKCIPSQNHGQLLLS